MKIKPLIALLAACGAAALHSVSHASPANDMEQAMEFYEKGQYLFALDRFRAAARGGDARAAEVLGVMYAVGPQLYPGVNRDATEASRWLDVAARGGRPVSRYMVCALRRHASAPLRPQYCFDWVDQAGKPGPQ